MRDHLLSWRVNKLPNFLFLQGSETSPHLEESTNPGADSLRRPDEMSMICCHNNECAGEICPCFQRVRQIVSSSELTD